MSFTSARLENLAVGERITEPLGFQAQKLKSGRIAFRLQKRIKGTGKKAAIYFHLGYFPDTSIQEARALAGSYRKECDSGVDPRKAIEKAQAARRAEDELDTITLRDAFKREYVERKPIKSVDYYRHVINGVSPKWWDKPIRSLTGEMVEEHFYSYKRETGKNRQAQQWVNILRSLWRRTSHWIISGQPVVMTNPFNVIDEPTQAEPRKGRLFPEEVDLVFKTYDYNSQHLLHGTNYSFAYPLGEEAQHNALWLLVFTGLRLREVLGIKWDDYFPRGRRLRGELVEEPLLRTYVQKTGEKAPRLHFIAATPLVEKVLDKQKQIRELFLESQPEKTRKDWESDYVFFSHSTMNKTMDGLDGAVERWRRWIGPPKIWKQLEEESRGGEGSVRDKNDEFSPHWLRHTFSTAAGKFGFTDEQVALAVGKEVKGKTSQKGYMHDDAVDQAELSRPMFIRVQHYLLTEELQTRAMRAKMREDTTGEFVDPTQHEPPDE